MVRSSTAIPSPVVKPNEGGAIKFPNVNDVLSGRGGRINNHEGNVHFRTLVAKVKLQYLSRQTKKPDKAVIAANIVDQVRKLDPPGRFLKECPDTGLWYEVGDERARRKAGQALREDGPEIKGEMMVIEEEKHRSKLSQLVYMSGQMPYDPMMPTPYMMPMMYPPMYPPVYTPPGQFPMPPSTVPAPVAPAFPMMTPYMYPPTMYPPAVVTPTVPAQTNTSTQTNQTTQTNPNQSTQSNQTAQQQTIQSNSNETAQAQLNQIQNQSKNSTSTSTSKKNPKKEKNKPTKKHVRSKPEEKKPFDIPKHKKPHLDSNNSSQTDITVNSSTLSDATDMDVDFYEYQQNIQVPKETPPKSSRRSQWRGSLKTSQKNNFHEGALDDLPSVIQKNFKATLDDLPSVIAAPIQEEKNYFEMRSSSSLPVDPDAARDETSYRKSLSMSDFDVIETLASMSSITQRSLFK